MILIFSSAEYCLRVARRMSLTTFSPWLCLVPGFLSHLHSLVVTMCQKPSLIKSPETVPLALTSDTPWALPSLLARTSTRPGNSNAGFLPFSILVGIQDRQTVAVIGLLAQVRIEGAAFPHGRTLPNLVQPAGQMRLV